MQNALHPDEQKQIVEKIQNRTIPPDTSNWNIKP